MKSTLNEPLLTKKRDEKTSHIFFTIANNLLTIASKEQLNQKDIPPLPSSIEAEEVSLLFQKVLNERANGSLLRAFHYSFGCEYYTLGILKVLNDLLSLSGPLLLNDLVQYTNNTPTFLERSFPIYFSNDTIVGYVLIAAMFLISFGIAFVGTQYNYKIGILTLKVKSALNTAVYSQLLTLRTCELQGNNISQGNINNFISIDIQKCMDMCGSFHEFWSLPLQVSLALYFLYLNLQFAFISGVCVIVFLIPVNWYIASKIGFFTKKMMIAKDIRVEACVELLRGIREIKMYNLIQYMVDRIIHRRKEEMIYLKYRKYLDALCVLLWASTPVIISLSTFSIFSLVMNSKMEISTVFSSLSLLGMLIYPMNAYPWIITGLREGQVSVNRLKSFLFATRIVNDQNTVNYEIKDAKKLKDLLFQDKVTKSLNFSWRPGLLATEKKCKIDLHNISLDLCNGNITAVIGAVGCGKSSLLCALLGELAVVDVENRSPSLLFSIPFDIFTSTSYCSQSPWIKNDTIKNNITCGSYYDASRFQLVVEVCCLSYDFEYLFCNGKHTVCTSNGSNLSGGQRMRINLARCLYKRADLYLLDDPLASIDATVSGIIYENIFRAKSGFLRGKSVYFVTNNLSLLNSDSIDKIIFMKDGNIFASGTNEYLNASTPSYREFGAKVSTFNLIADSSSNTNDGEVVDLNKKKKVNEQDSSQNMEEDKEIEFRAKGKVKNTVLKSYFNAIGCFTSVITLFSLLLSQLSRNFCDWWLFVWTTEKFGELGSNTYVSIYLYIGLFNVFATILRSFLFAYGGLQGCKNIFNQTLLAISLTPISFFDKNSIGRLINRFSRDVFTVDEDLPFQLNILLAQTGLFIGSLVVICYSSPWSLTVLPLLGMLYYYIQKIYRPASRDLKRIESTSNSPIFDHFEETITGAIVIRSMNYQEICLQENITRLNTNLQCSFASLLTSQWLALRLQMIGALVVVSICVIAIIQKELSIPINPGLFGLALTYSLPIVGNLNGLINSYTNTEKEMISIERLDELKNVPREEGKEREEKQIDNDQGEIKSKSPSSGSTPSWPNNGRIQVTNLTVRYENQVVLPIPEKVSYSTTGALRNIFLTINDKEKVLIVGRSGAGKSSFLSTLLRMTPWEGDIMIDSKSIKNISLEKLRDIYSIIPQKPLILHASIRENLDPLDKYSDEKIWNALEAVQLKIIIANLGKGLSIVIGESKDELYLSVGQAQLLCIARALLKESHILLLDEASASLDEKSAEIINDCINRYFSEKTVICISHRLDHVSFYNKIVVFNEGEIVEVGTLSELMGIKGYFYKLISNK